MSFVYPKKTDCGSVKPTLQSPRACVQVALRARACMAPAGNGKRTGKAMQWTSPPRLASPPRERHEPTRGARASRPQLHSQCAGGVRFTSPERAKAPTPRAAPPEARPENRAQPPKKAREGSSSSQQRRPRPNTAAYADRYRGHIGLARAYAGVTEDGNKHDKSRCRCMTGASDPCFQRAWRTFAAEECTLCDEQMEQAAMPMHTDTQESPPVV